MSELKFTWQGVSSDKYGIEVMRLPDGISAAQRGTVYTVSGRDGNVYVDDGALDEIVLMVECYLPYEQKGAKVASLDDIRKWLRGSGEFTQSDIPGRVFRSRITDQITFQPVVVGFADRVFGLTLYAEPYQYVDPPEFVPVVSSGQWVENPGAESRPKITVTGTGDITLEIIAPRIEGKHQIISIESLEEGIVIDSERMICTGLGPLPELLNNKVEMDGFPVLYEGTNEIKWTGNVTQIAIEPNWRFV